MIQNFDRAAWDRFGYDVAIDSNVVVVGSYSEDELEDGVSGTLTNPGSAHIFERDAGGAWSQVQKIVPLDRSSGDHFSYSLDIHDTLMVVGAHSDNEDEFVADYLEDAGSAYIFTKNSSGVWSQYQKIDASDRDSLDQFGISCSVWGTTVMVGAFNQAWNADGVDSLYQAGAVYAFNTQLCEPDTLDQALNICSGESVVVGSSTYTISGSYTDVLVKVDGCDSIVNTALTVDPPVTSSHDVEICFGATYSIGSSTYSTSGIYEDTLTGTGGCDSVVTTNLSVKPEIAVDQDVSVCWGESYTIGSSTYTTAGTYVDVLTSSDWCDSTITTHLTIELPVDVSITQVDNYLTANQDGASYQWYDCDKDEIVDGATSQSWWAYGLGNFACIVDVDGCVDTTACTYVSTMSTPENMLAKQIGVFPNPNKGRFTVELPDGMMANMEVLNNLGEVVYHAKQVSGKTEIELSGVPAGIYHLRVLGDVVVVKKVVVQ